MNVHQNAKYKTVKVFELDTLSLDEWINKVKRKRIWTQHFENLISSVENEVTVSPDINIILKSFELFL